MKTQTIIKLMIGYQKPFKDEDLVEMNDDNSISLFITFKGVENHLEIVVNSSTVIGTLESDSGILHIQEIYIQEGVDYDNVYFIDGDSVRSISTTDY